MLRRIDWASGFGGHIGERDVADVSETALGPLLRPVTLGAIRRAGSRRDAMTLLLPRGRQAGAGGGAFEQAAGRGDPARRTGRDGGVVPYGDPGLAVLRAEIVPPPPGHQALAVGVTVPLLLRGRDDGVRPHRPRRMAPKAPTTGPGRSPSCRAGR
jgi:hypothetical protein